MATIDKEQRARRKRMKTFHELNQMLKTIFVGYIVVQGSGCIYGNPVNDRSGKPNTKYYHSFLESKGLLDEFPCLSNAFIDSHKVFLAFRDDKPEDIALENGNVTIVGENGKYNVGFILNPKQVENSIERFNTIMNEIQGTVKNNNTMMQFTDEMVNALIGYEKIIPKFYNDDSMVMHLAISEFPLLKKLKHCLALMHDAGKNFFDVVFVTFDEKETVKFWIKRRFIKIIYEEESK